MYKKIRKWVKCAEMSEKLGDFKNALEFFYKEKEFEKVKECFKKLPLWLKIEKIRKWKKIIPFLKPKLTEEEIKIFLIFYYACEKTSDTFYTSLYRQIYFPYKKDSKNT